jgi:trimethylamine:corrinoid methyltransferase-like protein
MKLNQLEVLEKDEIELIHGESLNLLESIGIKVESEEARDLLNENGAIVDNSNHFVKFPEE